MCEPNVEKKRLSLRSPTPPVAATTGAVMGREQSDIIIGPLPSTDDDDDVVDAASFIVFRLRF
jgi:hypothetical protein